MELIPILRLSPKATLIERENKIGVSCAGDTIWAKNSLQVALLRKLWQRQWSIDDLKKALLRERDGPKEDSYAALLVVDFIRTFNDVIEDKLGEF